MEEKSSLTAKHSGEYPKCEKLILKTDGAFARFWKIALRTRPILASHIVSCT